MKITRMGDSISRSVAYSAAMSQELAVRVAADLTATKLADLEAVDLVKLEEALGSASELVTEEINTRVRAWAAEGKTQKWIAGELGVHPSAVSQRMARYGITPSRPTKAPLRATAPVAQSDDELLEGEIVRNDPPPPARAAKPKRDPLFVITAAATWEDDIDSMTPRECEKQLVAVREALEFFRKLEEALIPKGTPLKSVGRRF